MMLMSSGRTPSGTYPAAAAVSRALRLGTGPALRRRRRVVGLNLAAAGALSVVALYQTGLIRHVPEPPLPLIDGDRVDADPVAYRWLLTPDALLGIASAGVTAALAAAGPEDRARTHPWLPLATAAKVLLDAGAAIHANGEGFARNRAFCMWCLLAGLANLAAVPYALPEAAVALREVRGRRLPAAT
jgi:hypothetical protein